MSRGAIDMRQVCPRCSELQVMIVIDYPSGLLFCASQRFFFFFFLMRHIIISNDSCGYLFLDNFPSLPLTNSEIHLRTLTNGRLDTDQVQLDV